MQQSNIQNFNHLSQFKDLKDFNNHIEQWMIDIKSMFTKSELIALKRLIRFSAKVAGVCNAKIATIVSATHSNNAVGISRSTFKRMILKAKENGLLLVHEAVRKNGSKTSNVYVFNRFCEKAEPSESQKLNYPIKTNNLSKTSNNNKYIRNQLVDASLHDEYKLDASFVSDRVPSEFVCIVRCFYDDAVAIEEYWKLVEIAAAVFNINNQKIEIAINAFRQLIRKVKYGKIKNSFGYYYGILLRKFKAVFIKESYLNWWDK